MGTSTDAELFYGYCWQVSTDEESTQRFAEEDEDGNEQPDLYEWPEQVLEARGVSNPWKREDVEMLNPVNADEPYASRGLTEIGRVLNEEWRNARAELEAEIDIAYFTHGGPDWRCPAIAIKSSRVSAERGRPRQIDPTLMPIMDKWNDQLDAWCALMNITLDPERKGEEWDGPGWFLVSDWTH
jgi:hypothetical protein